MRKCVRAVLLVVLGVLSTAVLGVLTAIMSAVSLAATALIVPGTGTPDATGVPNYMEHALERYIAPFSSSCNDTNDCALVSAQYPASFFPLVIFPGWCEPGRCDTWNTSVEKGVISLHGLLTNTALEEPFVVFGYSQGGAVVSNELRAIRNNETLLSQIEHVVLIGNIYNPDGGLFTRLGFLPTIPFLNITFGPATPMDVFGDQGKITTIGFEYDPVIYAPLYWGNPLAMLNALAAFETVHGYYLTPTRNPDDPIAYGYTPQDIEDIYATGCPGPHCRVDEYGNEYWMLPATSLPIFDLIMSVVPDELKPLVQPIVDLVSPAVKVLIDLAYDWSGDPAEERYLSLLPFSPTTNWVQVGFDLVAAIQEGIENVFGGQTVMIAPPDANLSDLGETEQRSAVTDDSVSDQPPALTVVPDDTTPTTDVVVDTTDKALVDDAGEGTTGDETIGDDATTDDSIIDDGKVDEEIAADEDLTTETDGTKDDETTVDQQGDDDTVTVGDNHDDNIGGVDKNNEDNIGGVNKNNEDNIGGVNNNDDDNDSDNDSDSDSGSDQAAA